MSAECGSKMGLVRGLLLAIGSAGIQRVPAMGDRLPEAQASPGPASCSTGLCELLRTDMPEMDRYCPGRSIGDEAENGGAQRGVIYGLESRHGKPVGLC